MTPEEKVNFIKYWLKNICSTQFAEWEWDLNDEILSLYDENDFLLEEFTWSDIEKALH